MTFHRINIWGFPYHINKLSLVQIRLQLFKWDHFHMFSLFYNLTSDDLWPWYMTFDCMNILRFPYYINKPSLVPIGLQLFTWGHFHIFSLFYHLTSDDLWPWYMTFDCMNIWRFPYYINKSSLVQIGLQLFKWDHFTCSAYFTTWPQMTFDPDIWPLTAWTYEGSHVISINQVWFQLDFQLLTRGHFHIFSLSYNVTSDDLWPWYVTFDLIKK